MNAAILIITALLSLSSFQTDSGSRGWHGIIPMHSTRADVEQLLGPRKNNDVVTTYYLKDENVLFHYSTGDCKSGRGVWDVPVDTVIEITVYPKPNPRLSTLKLDKKKFKRTQDGHIEAIVSYVNEEDGLSIEVNEETETVMGYYYGTSSEERHLRCAR